MKEPLNVYQKIMRAAEKGYGLRLTPQEVWELSMDTAIVEAAGQYIVKQETEEAANWLRITGTRKPGPLA